MNWFRFVKSDRESVRKRSEGSLLDQAMLELAETGTLANWVRETNSKIYGHY